MVNQSPTRTRLLWHQGSSQLTSLSTRSSNGSDTVDAGLSLFQLNDSVCLIQGRGDLIGDWSCAIPGLVRGADLDSDCQRLAAMVADKLLLSKVRCGLVLNYLPLPVALHGGGHSGIVRFNPSNGSQVLVSCGRDIRVLDLTRCTADTAKSIMTISGAAAQASPASFTFLSNTPNVLATGWDLPSNSYIRLVDLREGSGKSVRIWKTNSVHGLCSNEYLASYSGNKVSIYDVRTQDDSLSFATDGSVSELHWSMTKRKTIGFLTSDPDTLSIRRLDIQRTETVPCSSVPGAFAFTSSNHVAVLDNSEGKLSILQPKTYPVSIQDPGSGDWISVSRTGASRRHTCMDSELIRNVKHISARIESSTLADVIPDEIDFCVSDDVHADTLAEPIHVRLADSHPVESGNIGLFGFSILDSVERSREIRSLISKSDFDLVMCLLRNELKESLQIVMSREVCDNKLQRSLMIQLLSSVDGAMMVETNEQLESFVGTCVALINSEISDQQSLSEWIKNRKDTNVFVRAVVACMYLESMDVLKSLAKEAQRSTVLRSVVLTGISEKFNQHINGSNVLNTALVGLMLGSQHESFKRAISFIRNQVCNRLRGECWRLRSVIDSMTNQDSAGGGSARLVCYYCNKPLVADMSCLLNRCPHRGCHKPLPSCCVCLESLRLNTAKDDEWTVWCSTCRHGGHKQHVMSWFDSFDECPVAGCNCQCAAIDGV